MRSKSSFVYYKDWADELAKLPDDLRLRIDDAVKRYVFYGEEPTDREVLYSMFALMRTQIDRDNDKWDAIRAKRSEAGNKGNEKRWGNRSQKSQNVANVANATCASQKSQNVANVAVDVDVDVDAHNVSTDVDTLLGVNRNSSKEEKRNAVSRPLSLNERQRDFYNELIPYLDKYTPELVRSFYDYWSEPNQTGTKMRRELEKTWDTGKRLARWQRSEKPTNGTPESRRDDAEAIIRRLMAEND